jgi:probable rRNA maturation factor
VSDSIDIALRWQPRTSWRAAPLLRRVALHAARAAGFRTGQLSIVVVGRRAMQTLHARYMNDPTVTDVLTFDLDSDHPAGVIDAEIVVCADVAREQARRKTHPPPARRPAASNAKDRPGIAAARAELALYIVHGILHLAGYDDHDPAAYKRMHAREDAILTTIGLGPVFGPTTRT